MKQNPGYLWLFGIMVHRVLGIIWAARRAAATVGCVWKHTGKRHLIATCNTKSLVFESCLNPTQPESNKLKKLKCWIQKWRKWLWQLSQLNLHKFRPCTWVKHQKPMPLPELHEAPEWHLDIVAVCCGCTWGCDMNGLTPNKHVRRKVTQHQS